MKKLLSVFVLLVMTVASFVTAFAQSNPFPEPVFIQGLDSMNAKEREDAFWKTIHEKEAELDLAHPQWPLEGRAWFSSVEKAYGIKVYPSTFIMPEAADLSQEEIIQRAKNEMVKVFGAAEESLEVTVLSFSIYGDDTEPNWYVHLGTNGYVLFDRGGNVISDPRRNMLTPLQQYEQSEWLYDKSLVQKYGPQNYAWPLEEQAKIDGRGLPAAGDMALEEAQKLAEEAVCACYNIAPGDLGGFNVYPSFFTKSRQYAVPYWRILFLDGDELAYTVYIHAQTKEILHISDGNGGND